MRTFEKCFPCFIRQAKRVVKISGCDEHMEEQAVQKINVMLESADPAKTPPEHAIVVYDILKELTGIEDPYKEIKKQSNENAKAVISDIRDKIRGREDRLMAAARLAMAGNIIDYGAAETFDLEKIIGECLTVPLAVDYSEKFIQMVNSIRKGTSILYLLDNCGEIVYDTLLLEILQEHGADITMVVRSGPVINDALMEDALSVGLDSYGLIMENGLVCPGTPVHLCSDELQEAFKKADIVISKGQGNFETLSEAGREIVFLLTIKCMTAGEYMADLTGIEQARLSGKGELALYIGDYSTGEGNANKN